MLVHVSLNQTGFHTPGLAPDARGVLLGKQGAALLPSLDRVVSLFRLLSEESSLDDILPGTHIEQVRSALGAREFLVVLPAPSSYLLDRCARVAALCGGLFFTGSGKHFVKYRDRRSPLGYDVEALSGEPADYVLYADSFIQGYARTRDIPFAQLVQQLAPRPVPGGPHRDAEDLSDRDARSAGVYDRDAPPGDRQRLIREVLWVLVRRGLGPRVLSYLLSSRGTARTAQRAGARVKISGALVTPTPPGAPGAAAGKAPLPPATPEPGSKWLLRVSDLPQRVLHLFLDLPGVEVFRPIGDNYVVQLGYRHPLRLESCASAFDKERFYLFSGGRVRCDELLAPPPLVPGESLLQVRFELDGLEAPLAQQAPPAARRLAAHPLAAQQVQLLLGPADTDQRRVSGVLVPWQRLPWFKQLVYLLPPTLLKGYRAAPIEEGLFVVCHQGIECLPMGEFFHEITNHLFVPVGMDFLPRVSEQVLHEHVGGILGKYVVFRPGTTDLGVQVLVLAQSSFEELGRRTLAPLQGPKADLPLPRPRQMPRETVLVNDELGTWPLWGFRGASREEDLP